MIFAVCLKYNSGLWMVPLAGGWERMTGQLQWTQELNCCVLAREPLLTQRVWMSRASCHGPERAVQGQFR